MVRLKLTGLVAVLVLASSAAFAFQETQPASGATTGAAQQSVTAPLAPDAAPASKGTAVRIPGLGTLGVIPKMDFGLELLYGAADQAIKRPDPSKTEQDDVLVGGRIKHKF
ncbi:MAG: hypothetical protein ABL904_08080 [Hyphomicrobiaceae bacterium]